MEALGYALGFGYGAICLLSAFLLSKLGVDKRITRKVVHIFIGFEWVILYLFHGATYHFLVVCLAFLALLVVAYNKNLLKMISSEGSNAPGTVYYAVSMSIMAAVSLLEPRFMLPFGVAVFATSIGDGFAGLVGQLVTKCNPKIYKEKSLVGTLVNLLTSTAVAFVFMFVFSDMGLTPLACVAIGFISAGVELISGLGLDNIGLPLSVSAFTYFATVHYDATLPYMLPIVLTPFVVAFVVQKNALTRGGLIAALLLDLTVSIALGNLGFALLLLFLALGVLTDKLKRRGTEEKEEKGSRRDFMQVLSNGFVPVVSAVIYAIIGSPAFLIAFVASLAEALADTAASSLGSYSKNTFDIFKLRRCEKGTSGGVSLCGTLFAVAFAFVIPLIAFLCGAISINEMLLSAVVATLGVFFDSFIGSVTQAKYRCRVCGYNTERRAHCGDPTELTSGLSFIRNDTVNALSTLFAALVAVFSYNIII